MKRSANREIDSILADRFVAYSIDLSRGECKWMLWNLNDTDKKIYDIKI